MRVIFSVAAFMAAALLSAASVAAEPTTTYFWTYAGVDPTYDEYGIPSLNILTSTDPNAAPAPEVTRLLGSAVFEESIMEKGWNSFTASPDRALLRSDPTIAWFTAGFSEGYLMMYQINQTMYATTNTNNYTKGTRAYIDQHAEYMLKTSHANRAANPFWAQVHKQLAMVRGIVAGYVARQAETLFEYDHTFADAMANNLFPEYDDVLAAVTAQGYDGNGPYPSLDPTRRPSAYFSSKENKDKNSRRLRSIDPENEHCSALIKVTDSDVFMGHNTWFRYSYYPGRVHKTYVMETAVSMSGSAGRIHSCDDWYQTSNLLGTMETSNMFTNEDLFMRIHPHTVAEFMRVMAANYLATNGREWVQIFGTNNSGTYCNQWMVVDFKLYTKGMSHKDLPKDFFWIAEEMPGLVVSADKTDFIREHSYWASYNIPHFPAVYQLAGFQQEADTYGSFFKWGASPRALIFARDHGTVTDLASMQKMMRYNDWQNDPLSAIPGCKGCFPANSPANSISSRFDLVPTDATYGDLPKEFARFFRFGYFGALDGKITSYDLITNNFSSSFQQGPTHDNGHAPFEWPADVATGKLPGMPQKFDFKWERFSPQQLIAVPAPLPPARDQYASIVVDVLRKPSKGPITFDANGVPQMDLVVGLRSHNFPPNSTAPLIPLATAAYNISGRATGWDTVTVTGDQTQLLASEQTALHAWYAAGVAEGYATAEAIHNVIDGRNFSRYPHADAFIQKHIDYMRSQCKKNGSPFYVQVRKMLLQMEGIAAGVALRGAHHGGIHKDKPVTFFDIFVQNFRDEYDDVAVASAPTDEARAAIIASRSIDHGDRCSALVKIAPEDYVIGHLTWAPFNIMIHKQHKAYVMDGTLTLTGNAGGVASGDDWYQTPHGLVVQETTNDIHNASLYSLIKPETFSEFLRAMAANYLARTSQEWTQIYSTEPSGTYTNQWMVFDDKLYTKGMAKEALKDGTFWVLEEIPGLVRSADMTAVLRMDGFWASYNVPYFQDIYAAMGYAAMAERDGDYYSYQLTSRARIFRREQHRVVDVPSMMKMLRFNQYQTDQHSVIPNCPECYPASSPGLAISSRFDLVSPSFHAAGWAKRLKRGVWGGSDVKVSSSALLRAGYRSANWAGPTHDDQPVFHWDDSSADKSYGRAGLVQYYNFSSETIQPSGAVPPRGPIAERTELYYVYNASAANVNGAPTTDASAVSETLRRLIGGDGLIVAGSVDFLGEKGLLATAALNHSATQIGWEQFTVAPAKKLFNTNGDDDLAAWFAAGVAEGYSSLQSIKNVINAISAPFTPKGRAFVDSHLAYMVEQSTTKGTRSEAERKKTNTTAYEAAYWRQVRKQLLLMEGIAVGFNLRADAIADADDRLSFFDVFQLNLNCEVGDIEGAADANSPRARDVSLDPEKCSALIKATDEDIFFSHVTWSGLDFLVGRQYKTYAMETTLSLTGSAGVIASGDDFQISSNGIAAQETTTAFYNKSLFASIKPETVSQFMRGVLASFLAKSAKEWTELFKMEHSGTYCNQWQALDYNVYKRGTPVASLPDNVLWIVEELPGAAENADVTWYMREHGMWPSFNIPFFENIYNLSGFLNHSKHFGGSYYSWTDNPRHKMYRRDAPKIANLTGMMRMMRYNQYQTDEYSIIPNCPKCTPNRAPKIAVAARGDLGVPEPEYQSDGTPYGRSFRQTPFGSCDAKITSGELMARFASVSEAGPTHDDQPVFSWYNYPQFPQGKLSGMIQTWDFSWSELTILSTDPPRPAKKDDDGTSIAVILGAAVGGAAVVFLAIAAVFTIRKRRAAAAAASGGDINSYHHPLNQEAGV